MTRIKQYKNKPADDTFWSRFIGAFFTKHEKQNDFDFRMLCPKCHSTIFGHYETDGDNFFFVCNYCEQPLKKCYPKSKEEWLSKGVWK